MRLYRELPCQFCKGLGIVVEGRPRKSWVSVINEPLSSPVGVALVAGEYAPAKCRECFGVGRLLELVEDSPPLAFKFLLEQIKPPEGRIVVCEDEEETPPYLAVNQSGKMYLLEKFKRKARTTVEVRPKCWWALHIPTEVENLLGEDEDTREDFVDDLGEG